MWKIVAVLALVAPDGFFAEIDSRDAAFMITLHKSYTTEAECQASEQFKLWQGMSAEVQNGLKATIVVECRDGS